MEEHAMQKIPFQYDLRPELPNVYGTQDYRVFRDVVIKIDKILTTSGFEHEIASHALEEYAKQQANPEKFYSGKGPQYLFKIFLFALRCNIARHLTGDSYRKFSVRLADSLLFQWFTRINSFDNKKPISKSSLERFEKFFDEIYIGKKIREWLLQLTDNDIAHSLGMTQSIDCSNILLDTTCIKSHIHYPVDWLFLRDAGRSLIKAIITIRNQGLKCRMAEPRELLKQMNKLSIEMTHSRRKKNSNKKRKSTLRKMKKLIKIIWQHAFRHRELLKCKISKTDWTERQAQQVISRINNIIDQLPCVIKQAHDRIISEKKISSAEKILSLYDKDVQVIVRGKAGVEVEFGQRLLLCEQREGLIIDWELFTGNPSDSNLLEPTINRIELDYGRLTSVCTDRGFGSEKADKFLEDKKIYNGTCPKSPRQLRKKLKEKEFVNLQTRRGQTEARIGIFKNVFLGNPLRSRLTEYKRHAINWCVLAHNLWVLSRALISDEKSILKKAA